MLGLGQLVEQCDLTILVLFKIPSLATECLALGTCSSWQLLDGLAFLYSETFCRELCLMTPLLISVTLSAMFFPRELLPRTLKIQVITTLHQLGVLTH